MFNAEKFIDESVKKLKDEIDDKALIAFSGGVDSTVCAALVNKAIGKQLVAVHVDTGYMRKDESENVKKLMEEIGLNYRFIDASNEFFSELKNVKDPEKKRKIIGEKFIRVFEKVAEESSKNIYADKAVYLLGKIHQFGMNDYVKAEEYYQELLAEYPNSIYADDAREQLKILMNKSS